MSNLQPLAERIRPQILDDFVGQEHLVGDDAPIRMAIASGNFPSIIFWGPPGTGKTTLANIIAKQLKRQFYQLSAISSGVKDIREVLANADRKDIFSADAPILFIDEIHRFSKSQQDSLLGAVEKGTITLIGATTENPSFEVISPLLSRCQVYILKPFGKKELLELIASALKKDKVLMSKNIIIKENEALLRLSGGDARKLLNILELVACSTDKNNIEVTNALVTQFVQQNTGLYDKGGEQHYDVISAFIKSMRGSDPNAAVYWLARMIVNGEDPKFIARRMLILASEDIGNADPQALVIATNCFQAVNVIGYPECELILSQTAVYLASSAKSNGSYMAIKKAKAIIDETGSLPVPLHLRNAPTKLMKELGYGKEYLYSHNYEANFSEQEYLPENLSGTKFYDPADNKNENIIRQLLKNLWKKKYQY